jgi:hypothetical protein
MLTQYLKFCTQDAFMIEFQIDTQAQIGFESIVAGERKHGEKGTKR